MLVCADVWQVRAVVMLVCADVWNIRAVVMLVCADVYTLTSLTLHEFLCGTHHVFRDPCKVKRQ